MAIASRSIRSARELAILACSAAMLAAPAVAQVPDMSFQPATEPRRATTIVGGNQSPALTFERCVDVQIGGDRGLGCLNERLKREVERTNPAFNLPPIDARSSDIKVGNANEAALRQQYGANYDRSVYPFRPPTPSYALPRR